ncbi:uncharacterized protein LOC110711934 [Chenopodium quinoa]|uniref:uncharacterized protein LOC110711934 n=1 Tax=Chenopodium quinoa TaxID=63459 RepID=UPI000B790F2D|nr:uncharacterized protein LOC110711934 [Chenopodium quinoa]
MEVEGDKALGKRVRMCDNAMTTWKIVLVTSMKSFIFQRRVVGDDCAKWQMNNFRNAINSCALQNVPFTGYEFTYDDGREGIHNTRCRLDRALATDAWLMKFPDSLLIHLDCEWSDHAPIKLVLELQNTMKLGEKPFKFEHILQTDYGCEGVVQNAWEGGWSLESQLALCTADRKTWSETLQAVYTVEEVKFALSQMHPAKVSGPYGMCPLFFQLYVGPLMSNCVLSILRGAPIPQFINRTYIALIPKKKDVDQMVDFRPISLCNVIYKLVLKVLANRLKYFLDEIISINQSAFTPGQLISNNIFVAFVLFHYMKNLPNKGGCIAMKLDMSKAFDKIEWDFLEAVLRRFGFDQNWCDRVMDCVRSVSFSVLVNGRPTDDFSPGRGIRQGDPISPYLFILCVEVFTYLLRDAQERGSLHGVRIAPTAPSISHLLFANGVPVSKCIELASMLGVCIVDIHDRYLGLPTVVGRSKKVITRCVKEKLWKKLQGWKGMQGDRKIHWLAWKKLCRPKNEGGLGFRDFKLFNWGLLGKQAWMLMLQPGTLVEQILKCRYYPNSTFMEADIGVNPSYTWRGIAEARCVVRRGMKWRVGNGESIRVWTDPWVPNTQSHMVISPRGEALVDMKVCDFIQSSPSTVCWNVEKLRQVYLPFECDKILRIPLSIRLLEDSLCWDLEKNGVYSKLQVLPCIKSFAWRALQNAFLTRHNIHYRVKEQDSDCSICLRDYETTVHALRDCKFAKNVWARSNFAIVAESRTHCIIDWWEGCLAKFDEVEAAAILTLCWAI